MNVTSNPHYWQDYTSDILNGHKDREATVHGYTNALDAVDQLQAIMGNDASLNDDVLRFLESEGLEVPDHDGNGQLNANELAELEGVLIDMHEQVSLSNSIAQAMEDQIMREITGTLGEKRNMFENEEEFI